MIEAKVIHDHNRDETPIRCPTCGHTVRIISVPYLAGTRAETVSHYEPIGLDVLERAVFEADLAMALERQRSGRIPMALKMTHAHSLDALLTARARGEAEVHRES